MTRLSVIATHLEFNSETAIIHIGVMIEKLSD